MTSEGNDDGLFLCRQDCRSGLLGSCRQVGNEGSRFPLSDCLRVDAVALCKPPQALLTMLYRSTDRRGALDPAFWAGRELRLRSEG